MLKRLRKNHPLLYCIGAEAVFLGSLFVSSYLVVIALLLFHFNFAYADDYLLGCIQELVGIGVAVVLLRRTGKGQLLTCRRNAERLFFYGLLYRFSASHYLSGGTLCCLYGTDKKRNQQGTSRRYQLCGGIRVVCFIYCLRSRLHQEDK